MPTAILPPDRAEADAARRLATVRVDGGVSLRVVARDGITAIADLAERGGWRAKFPDCSDGLEAVLINTGGGLVGGDRVACTIDVGEHARAMIATQSAERVYRSLGPSAQITTTLTAAAGATLAWLPQETILFDSARLSRRLEVVVAAGAKVLIHEALVFGRGARGESIRQGEVDDRWRIRRDDVLVHAEATSLSGDMQAALDRPAIGGCARAQATVLYIAGDAEDRLEAARAALGQPQARAALSAWNGILVARFLGQAPDAMRADVARLLVYLRGEPLPRVWGS